MKNAKNKIRKISAALPSLEGDWEFWDAKIKDFDGFTDFMTTIHDVEASNHPEIVERIFEGAQMKGMSLVQWIVRAINMQFGRDCIEKGEREGTVVFTGHYDSNNQPLYAATECIKRGLN